MNSKIEWTDHTFNPWWGCTRVSAACDNCYADSWANRLGYDNWGHRNPRRFLSEQYWKQPYAWDQNASELRVRKRVFCASMADVFEWRRGLKPWREKLWQLIDDTPNLDWLLLTKRPHLVNRLSPWGDKWPENVWLGTTVETQKWADRRIPQLIKNPARLHFLSCEPLLGSVDIDSWLSSKSIQWVIAGGESGPNARPSDPRWLCELRDACIASDTPFHFKQWGEWAPIDTTSNRVPRCTLNHSDYSVEMGRYGKRAAGRELAKQTWDQFPNLET